MKTVRYAAELKTETVKQLTERGRGHGSGARCNNRGGSPKPCVDSF